MSRSLRLLAVLTALFLVLGASPVRADTGDESGDEAVQENTTAVEGSHINGKFLILFAEGFDATEDDLIALQELGFGFGDLFKLNLYSSVLGVSVDDLVAGATFDEGTGEWDFDWGALKRNLTDEQLELLDGLPRNFGQFVSAAVRHQGRNDHQPDHAGRDGVKPDRGNRPEHAGKGGNGDS